MLRRKRLPPCHTQSPLFQRIVLFTMERVRPIWWGVAAGFSLWLCCPITSVSRLVSQLPNPTAAAPFNGGEWGMDCLFSSSWQQRQTFQSTFSECMPLDAEHHHDFPFFPPPLGGRGWLGEAEVGYLSSPGSLGL